jgi:DNA polymerase-3 subunit delta'
MPTEFEAAHVAAPGIAAGARAAGRPIGHDDVLAALFANAREGRLSHALLLAGPAGVGKFLVARWLAQGLLCERGPGEPCLACGACRRVAADSHPDLFVVDAHAAGFDKLTIHFVARRDVRSSESYQGEPIEAFLDLRSAEGRGKVVVVREAERMTEEAQNALLKTLEEPRPGVVLVLEASAPLVLLATVRSRLVRLDLQRLSAADVGTVLAAEGALEGLEPAERARLLRLAEGAPGRATRLAERNVLAMRELFDEALAGRADAAGTARAFWSLPGEFSARTESASRRLRAETFLDLGLEVLGDLERRAAGLDPDGLVHGDAPEPAATGEHSRRRRLDVWVAARQDVLLNLGPEALVDRALGAL